MERALSFATATRRIGADAAAAGTLHRRAEETVDRNIEDIDRRRKAIVRGDVELAFTKLDKGAPFGLYLDPLL
jgi:hypothetical protein